MLVTDVRDADVVATLLKKPIEILLLYSIHGSMVTNLKYLLWQIGMKYFRAIVTQSFHKYKSKIEKRFSTAELCALDETFFVEYESEIMKRK
jgi:hypothetical protein